MWPLAAVGKDEERVVYYNYPAAGTVGGVLSRLDNIASCDNPDPEDMYAQ